MKKEMILGAITVIGLTACNNGIKYDATGIFEATSVTVSAETGGKIMKMEVSEGDNVKCDEPIALIDTTILRLQQNQIGSQREAIERTSPDVAAQAAMLRTQISHQQRECERYGRLLASGATTEKQYDDAQAQLTSMERQLTALLSTLNKNKASITENAVSLQYQWEQIGVQIDKSMIKSPINGTILTKYAETGEYAVPGKALYKIANLNDIYLRAYFTAQQLARIKIGQEVKVIADFGGDEQYEYSGRITWIAQESEFTPKTIQTQDSRANLVYAVKISVKNDGRLKLGQYGEVKL